MKRRKNGEGSFEHFPDGRVRMRKWLLHRRYCRLFGRYPGDNPKTLHFINQKNCGRQQYKKCRKLSYKKIKQILHMTIRMTIQTENMLII